jgi:hypothetical protein
MVIAFNNIKACEMGLHQSKEVSGPESPDLRRLSLSSILDPEDDVSTFPAPHPVNEMDDLSAALAIQLLLEDSERLSSELKGNSTEEWVSDAALALSFYTAELEQNSIIIADRQMTRSIDAAVQPWRSVLAGLEHRGSRDLEVGQRLGGPSVRPADIARRGPANAESEDESAVGLGGPYLKKGRCAACYDNKVFFCLARTPCGHEYCKGCLTDLFKCAMIDESLFPPRCCSQPIPPATVRSFLTAELIDQFEKKKIEFGTSNRTYCSSPRCSAFITMENIEGDSGTCLDCNTVTCTICKATGHEGDCPADTGLHQVLATAAVNGWQRCYSCRRVVELDTGCNHMTYVFSLVYITNSTNEQQMHMSCSILLRVWRTMEDVPLRPMGRRQPPHPRPTSRRP